MDLLDELDALLAEERSSSARPWAQALGAHAPEMPLLHGADVPRSHPVLLPFPLVPPTQLQANDFPVPMDPLERALASENAPRVWQGPPSRLLVEVPLSLHRADIMPVKSTMVLNPTSLQYAFERVVHDERSMAETSNSMLRKPTSLQEYARGKIGNVPFAPGGDSLLKTTSDAAPAHDDDAALKAAKANEMLDLAQRALRSANAPATEDLDALLVDAPGLASGLTRDDVARLTRGDATASGAEAAKPAEAPETVGANPAALLQPYFQVISDEDSLRALQRSIADEKAVLAMTTNTLSIQSLLTDDDMDDVYLDEAETVDTPPEAAPEPTATPALAFAAEDNDDDAELDLSLDSVMHFMDTMAKPAAAPVLEWASAEPVDVSNFHAKVPDMAMQFPFELDSFQKQAVVHLENHDCVFIAAHTSAGKTVVAEYAIAMSQKHMTRTIYTSPIKALSNQKYRDFRTKFGVDNVGLITGDVSINPQASCLVMTTEILRSMLYRGADVIRDIEWVIFDEIHYLNDSERGVVWEEVIIMLPEHVSMVFLSATTPNTFEFSDWIGRTKQKKIHVISTHKRPIPLSHHLYAGGEVLPVMDPQGQFLSANYSAAVQRLKPKDSKTGPGRGGGRTGGRGGGDKAEWTKLVRLLQEKQLLPVVVFAFSKRLCEESAHRLAGMDLSSSSERSEIHLFCQASISRLQGLDQHLPQVLQVREMLLRGIGVHHGGLLPILKEMVEILFARGLVKVLFSTETFAMGVNMPARTVVFNGTRKHDGKAFRDLLPGEYTQMAGRAGRRGLDTVGTVIIACWGEVPDGTSLRTMLMGQPTKLESQFRLTYNMILNLLRVEDMTVEDMIKRSFSEFRTQKALAARNIPQAIQKAKKLLHALEADVAATHGGHLDLVEVERFFLLQQSTKAKERALVHAVLNSRYAPAALCVGRVVVVTTAGLVDQLAIVLQVDKTAARTATVLALCPATFVPPVTKKAPSAMDFFKPKAAATTGLAAGATGALLGKHYAVLDVPESCIDKLTKHKAAASVRQLVDATDAGVLSRAVELLVDLEAQLPLFLDPRTDLKMLELESADLYSQVSHQYTLMAASPCFASPFLMPVLAQYAKIDRLRLYMATMTAALSNHSLSLFPDFQQRLRVLTRLGYIATDNTVQVKGRVACEVNTCEELVLTEIIFENVLAELEPEEIVAVLSALIFQEKTQNAPTLTPRLLHAQTTVQAIATSLGLIQLECHLEIDPAEYAKSILNFGLMEVVYEWSRGMPFKSICELTDVPEGSIVRCITRLDEVCREVRNAARVIGDPRLYRKMEIASESIKRDVVFASSLYLS
ncbi:DEAD/DEAH box RNA helicase [Achlya hypogyna]|uniref:DEAD/DEAH box RNA helicase n=1 Tax=Achlya hypogyna TaxID=1202772 RepID=A0A1V9ZLM2_ACHHY|nr:DEAD/DEAH box RNA helicase [Achlya hypogyna]